MVLRLNIDQIALATRDWIFIVEIECQREIPEKKCRFQNLILEDEHIKAVLYADEIEQYEEMLKLMNTYLISTARVKVSQTSYGKNILSIVLRCGPKKYVGEITICDNQKIQFLLTLWESFREIEGIEIEAKMAKETDLIVILGRSIGISTFQGLSLQSRYSSTIRVAPNYPQVVELTKWAKENKSMLLSRASDKTSTTHLVVLTPVGQQVISIEEILSPASDANKRSAQKIERIFIVQNAIGKQYYFLGTSPSP
ncbi:hypothetical protein EJD97_002528 [Solanum chilense]|uniref:Replication protein A OB domain-containing protein n=1 Tax=Solanum chilense TaxID=4083 RepID=A0A6N2C376_SOLCI|nr:hypothetical protein EJD97_002528 [Solanum chilense]